MYERIVNLQKGMFSSSLNMYACMCMYAFQVVRQSACMYEFVSACGCTSMCAHMCSYRATRYVSLFPGVLMMGLQTVTISKKQPRRYMMPIEECCTHRKSISVNICVYVHENNRIADCHCFKKES